MVYEYRLTVWNTTINKEEVDLKIYIEEIIDVVRPLLNKYNAKIFLTSKDNNVTLSDFDNINPVELSKLNSDKKYDYIKVN